MPTVSQVTVTSRYTPLYGATAAGDTLQVINLDTENTVYIGYDTGISPGDPNTIPVGPLASNEFATGAPLYAVAAQQLTVAVAPGGTGYSPGSLAITGPVTAEITGPVTAEIEGTVDVAGTVAISGTPTVDIGGTPTVNVGNTPSVNATISGTPSVNINSGSVNATITGTPSVSVSGTTDVQVQNANIDVIGGGGYILPGQAASIFSNASAYTVGPGSSSARGPFNVTNYNSIDFLFNGATNSSTASGAALCYQALFDFSDPAGNLVRQIFIPVLVGAQVFGSMPCYGTSLEISLINIGTVGNLSYPANMVSISGSYRPRTSVILDGDNAGFPGLSGFTRLSNSADGIDSNGWVYSLPTQNLTAGTKYIGILEPYSGPVSGEWQVVTAALANDATIVDLTNVTVGNLVNGTSQPGIVRNLSNSVTNGLEELAFNLPTGPCALVANGPSSGTGGIYLSLTGQNLF